jgi:hypothetical protein
LYITSSAPPLNATPSMAVSEFQDFSFLVRKKSSSKVARAKPASIASGKMKKTSRRAWS